MSPASTVSSDPRSSASRPELRLDVLDREQEPHDLEVGGVALLLLVVLVLATAGGEGHDAGRQRPARKARRDGTGGDCGGRGGPTRPYAPAAASAARAAWPIMSSRWTERGSSPGSRRSHVPSERSSHANMSSASERSTMSIRSPLSSSVLDRREQLDAGVEVARHEVGRADVDRRLAVALEGVDPRVLEEPADDRDDADVLRHALHARDAGSRSRARSGRRARRPARRGTARGCSAGRPAS